MKISLAKYQNGSPYAYFDDEPEPRGGLLQALLMDADGQEDYYLGEIAKAEAGETILNCYNNLVDAQMYPDGRLIIEELRYTEEDEKRRGPPARIELTLAEGKQLLLDWLEAKKRFYEERDQRRRAAAN